METETKKTVPVSQNAHFILDRQWWFISCLSKYKEPVYESEMSFNEGSISEVIDESCSEMKHKAKFLEGIAKEKFKNLIPDNFRRINPKDVKVLIDLAKRMQISCTWHPYIRISLKSQKKIGNKDSEFFFKTLGFFEFEVVLDQRTDNEKLTSNLIQQFPNILKGNETHKKGTLFEYNEQESDILLDVMSPMFNYILSIDCGLEGKTQIDNEFILNNKKELGYWLNIYSGQFKDYNEDLFNQRIRFQPETNKSLLNLSNRLHELIAISRNSAFIYLDKEEYAKKIEKNYIAKYKKYKYQHPPGNNLRKNIQLHIGRIRSLLFLLLKMLEILNTLEKSAIDIDISGKDIPIKTIFAYEKKLNLKLDEIQDSKAYLDDVIMRSIFFELGFNRYEQYTTIIKYLMDLYQIEYFLGNLKEKTNVIEEHLKPISEKFEELRDKRKEKISAIFGLVISIFGLSQTIDVVLPDTLTLLKTILNAIVIAVFGGMILLYVRVYLREKKFFD